MHRVWLSTPFEGHVIRPIIFTQGLGGSICKNGPTIRTVRCSLFGQLGACFSDLRDLLFGHSVLENTIHSIVGLARAEKALFTVTGISLGPFLHIDLSGHQII